MGTFETSFPVFSIVGSYNDILVDSTGVLCYLNQINNVGVGYLSISYLPSVISIDGATPIPLSSLPAGFNIIGQPLFRGQSGSDYSGSVVRSATTDTAQLVFTHSSRTVSVSAATPGFGYPLTAPVLIITGGYKVADMQLFANIVGNSIINPYVGPCNLFIPKNPVITGSYQIISSQWIIDNLTHPTRNYFTPGDSGQIHNNTDTDDIFDTVTEIYLGTTVVLPPYIIQTKKRIVFTIPSIPNNTVPVTITNPTEFNGDAVIGPLRILTPNRSGIYSITSGATHDTLYLGDGTNTTEDVAIPDPTIKTGFIGG